MTRALTAAELADRYGMTARYWTRMAAEGKVPGADQGVTCRTPPNPFPRPLPQLQEDETKWLRN